MDDLDRAQELIDARTADAIREARQALPTGDSAEACECCGVEIPDERRRAMPGCRLCVGCKEDQERYG